ncbi:helix-turn-helix domain-containing protein [Paenibacillus hemerocallicola]|uniref:Helix-turn-helix domain-containing protein n=2 Tax=Paenibacillus hemerocallicola TaxID=1172614 RepID=A0A5C4SWE9_9BACL|nr:helix-turn-helix domain-containing protein [Paenibacillus hemerocallicola]
MNAESGKVRMSYQSTLLKPAIVIRKMFTIYYFEFGKHFVFRGESHDFWELLYVDKGELEVWADDRCYRMGQGTLIFHKPNEFHKFHAENDKAPNVIVLTFDCRSKAMKRFENAVIKLNDEERSLLAKIIKEGVAAFEFPFRHPLVRKADAPIGAEQMIKLNLEALLIQLLRREDWHAEPPRQTMPAKEKEYDALTTKTMGLLADSVGSRVTLEELSDKLGVSKTVLKDVFKNNTGQTVMEFFSYLKMEQAKLLIREGTYNFTEISALLGFSTVHVFSKAFKRSVDMTPSEYAKSVKGRLKE